MVKKNGFFFNLEVAELTAQAEFGTASANLPRETRGLAVPQVCLHIIGVGMHQGCVCRQLWLRDNKKSLKYNVCNKV